VYLSVCVLNTAWNAHTELRGMFLISRLNQYIRPAIMLSNCFSNIQYMSWSILTHIVPHNPNNVNRRENDSTSMVHITFVDLLHGVLYWLTCFTDIFKLSVVTHFVNQRGGAVQ
jgi:hypothetical protein